MPKSPSTKTQVRKDSQLFVLKHDQKRVLVQRPKSYKLAIDAACKHFPCLSREKVVLQTKELDICAGYYVDITDETWEDAVGSITSLEVLELPQNHMVPGPQNKALVETVPAMRNSASAEIYRIEVILEYMESEMVFKVSKSTLLRRLVESAARNFGKESDELRATHLGTGERVNFNDTLDNCGVMDGDRILLYQEQRGGKPVIYLYSPSDIEVSVKLSLTPEWRFSAIYPFVPTKINRGEQIEWNVRTHEDGTLNEKNTGLNVSYLFWEAETDHLVPPSPPPSPTFGQSQAVEHFSPISSDLCDSDSVVLSVVNITPYLDKALQALGLHTEARTSFITYWLPSILKHKYVALRFIPQISYERAAPLDVSPKPDIITRIFMVFKGIPEDQLVDWHRAQSRAEEDVIWWRHVVGVDIAKARDAGLFRVLEWGGMEVLRG